ncbi:MAG: hypothetical protein ABS939_15305 [Psychrobacillus sp.]
MTYGNEILEKQTKLEHLIVNNIPEIKGLYFYDDYALYPEVIYDVSNANSLEDKFARLLKNSGFSLDAVEVSSYQEEEISELRFTFDLELFDNDEIKRFFKLIKDNTN